MALINRKLLTTRACIGIAFAFLSNPLHAQTVKPPLEMTQSSQTQNGITITVAVQKNAIAGEPVVMRIRLLNQSKEAIAYDLEAQYPRYDIVAKTQPDFKYDVTKTRFGLSNFDQNPRRKRLHTTFFILNPGKSSLVVLNLARCFDFSEPDTVQVTVSVPYQRILRRPITLPGAILSQSITAPPVVFEIGVASDDSTFGRNKQEFGDPFP